MKTPASLPSALPNGFASAIASPFARSVLLAMGALALCVSLTASLRLVVRPEAFTTNQTADRAILNETERVFGHADIEAIVVDGTNRSDPLVREAMKGLTRELKKAPGVKSIVSPAHAFRDAKWLPVVVWSSDRTAGRILLQVDESSVSYAETSDAIDLILTRYPQLNPLRLSAHHLYTEAAHQLSSRITSAMLWGGCGLIIGLVALGGLKAGSFHLAALGLTTTAVGLLPPALLGTPMGILGALSPLLWLLLHAVFIVSLASDNGTSKTIWASRLLPLLLLLIPALTTWRGESSAEVQSFSQLWILQILAMALPITFVVLKRTWFTLTPRGTFPLKMSIGRLSPLIRRLIAAATCSLVLYLNFADGSVRFEGLVRSVFPETTPGQQLIRTVRTIFPADKTLSVVLTRTDGNGLDKNDDAFIERIANQLRQHPDVYTVYSPGEIETFQKLDRSARVLAGGQNSFPWLLRSFYRSEDSKTSRLLIETGVDGTPLLRLQRELTDIIRAQLNLGASGLALEKLRPTPPRLSGLPKDQMPADFDATVPEPVVSTPPPAILHLGAYVVSREAAGESAFLSTGGVLKCSNAILWIVGLVFLAAVTRAPLPMFLWTIALLLLSLSGGSAESGILVERVHPGTALGAFGAQLSILICLPGILLLFRSTAPLGPATIGFGAVAFVCCCLGYLNSDSALIKDLGMAGLIYMAIATLLILSLWHDLVAGFERCEPLVISRVRQLLTRLPRKRGGNVADN